MNKKERFNAIQIIKGGLSDEDGKKIDSFFNDLEILVNLSLYDKRLLFNHYLDAFNYYLENNKSVDEIIKLVDLSNLSDFYSTKKRQFFTLDSAGIVYPLGMRFNHMQMFRFSATLKENVIPEILQLALDFTIKRFPSMSTVVKTGFFWHYLETVNNVPVLEEENDIPCKPISIYLRSFRSFRTMYYKNRISVEFFHALTDGAGALVFLKTLIREYYILLGRKVSLIDGVFDINDGIKPEETVNEFINHKGEVDYDTFIDKKAVQMDGKLNRFYPYQIIHFHMDVDKLKEVSKKYNGTITSFLLANIFKAIKSATSKKEGEVVVEVPVNLRQFNNSKTLRNYSMYFLAKKFLDDINDTEKLVSDMNEQLKEKANMDYMKKKIATANSLISKLSHIPLIIKNPIFQLLYTYFSASVMTCVFSNLGVVKMPEEIQDDIDDFIVLFPPDRPNRASCTLITYNNKAILTIVKLCKEDAFESALYDCLSKQGLKIEVKGSVEYES